MRTIPKALLHTILADPYYLKCARAGEGCEGRITLEHAFIYASKQINEKWAIIPLCWYHHLGLGMVKETNQLIALRRATPEDLEKYPKTNWMQLLKSLESSAGQGKTSPSPKKKVAKKKKKTAAQGLYVTRTEPFAATIRMGKDGKKTLVLRSPVWYAHQINKFKDGTQVTLEVHSKKPKRTDAQNAYYWGVYLPVIARETGETNLDALHTLFKGMFLSKGITEVLGKKVRVTRSTTDLGIAEFCQYIIDIEGETQVAAPPTENYDLAPLSTVNNIK